MIRTIRSTITPNAIHGLRLSTPAGITAQTEYMGTLILFFPTHTRRFNLCFSVNLGGWFVLEPFISPALFQKYPGVVDEWNLCLQMTADTSAGGGIQQLEQHYDTFIVRAPCNHHLNNRKLIFRLLQTEQDIAQIAGAGLNWVRVPIPFWAIETWPGEPFLAKTSWKCVFVRFDKEWRRSDGVHNLTTIDTSFAFSVGVASMAFASTWICTLCLVLRTVRSPFLRLSSLAMFV
jgi:hypothetical protein